MTDAGDQKTPANKAEKLNAEEQVFGFGYNQPAYSNRVLVFESQDQTPPVRRLVNSLILAAESKWFKTMFESRMKEAIDDTQEIVIQVENAVDQCLHETLVKWCYTDNLPMMQTHELMDLMALADKYMTPALLQVASRTPLSCASTAQPFL